MLSRLCSQVHVALILPCLIDANSSLSPASHDTREHPFGRSLALWVVRI